MYCSEREMLLSHACLFNNYSIMSLIYSKLDCLLWLLKSLYLWRWVLSLSSRYFNIFTLFVLCIFFYYGGRVKFPSSILDVLLSPLEDLYMLNYRRFIYFTVLLRFLLVFLPVWDFNGVLDFINVYNPNNQILYSRIKL